MPPERRYRERRCPILLSTIVLPHKFRDILPHLVHRLAVVPPLLGVPPLGMRVSELPLQWQGRSLGGVRVVAILHGVHVGVASREVLAGLLGVVGGLVGCGLANGSRGIGAREGGGEAGDRHLARDGCALRKAQGSEGGGHCVWGVDWRVEGREQTLNARLSSWLSQALWSCSSFGHQIGHA